MRPSNSVYCRWLATRTRVDTGSDPQVFWAVLGPRSNKLFRTRSAIYGCGYNSCGCNLKLSQVRSGAFGVDLGPVWDPKGPKPDPDRTSDNFKLQAHP